MPRRQLDAGSDSGLRDVRDRLSVSLGGAADPGGQDSHDTGLLDLSGHRDEAPVPLSARFRGRTGVRTAALIGVLAVVLAGSFWGQALTGMPDAVPLSGVSPSTVSPPPVDGGDTAAPEADPAAGQESIFVHVSGAVARPGVIRLPRGSRLHEALALAGGSTPTGEPDQLNLASILEDGQKVLVPARGEPGQPDQAPGETGRAGGGGSGGSGHAVGGKVDLNTAGVEELGTLPRVGPVLAQRIVDWRRQHGRFKTVEELDAVDGVGPKLLEAILPLVRV